MTRVHVDLSISDDDLIAAYIAAAIANGAAIDGSDYRTANREHDRGVAYSSELRRRGSHAEQRLLNLLEHENPWVRYWAATDVLRFAPSEAEAVLERLATLPRSLVRLSAETMLTEWKAKNPSHP